MNGQINIEAWNDVKFKGEIREGSYWNGQANLEDFKGEIREGKKWIGYGIGENNEYNMIYKGGKNLSL